MNAIVATVVIPHYEDPLGLDQCLSALEGQSISRDRFEIIVADNGSPMGSEAVRAVIAGRAALVEVPTKGAGPARNGGVEQASADVLAFTDCDCIPEPGWLEAGMAALSRGDIVGGGMMVLVEDRNAMTPCEAFETVFAFNNARYVLRKHFTVTANLFVRRSDFVRVGGFRSGVSEDLEWCLRARSLGLRIVFEPEARVGHPARRTWRDLKKKWRRLVSEQHQVTCERRFGAARWIARSWALPASILPDLIKIGLSDRLPRPRDRLAAATMLVRIRLWRFFENHRILLEG